LLNNLLPWIAFAVGLAAVLSRDGARPSAEDSSSAPPRVPPVGAILTILVLAAAAVFGAWKFGADWKGSAPMSYGFAGGLAVALLSEWIGRSRFQRGAGTAGPMGIAVAAVGALMFAKPEYVGPHQIGLGFGLAAGAWILSALESGAAGWPIRTALFANAMLLVDILGKEGPGGRASHAGLALGIAAAFVGAASLVIANQLKIAESKRGGIAAVLFAVLFGGAAWAVATRYVWLSDFWRIAVGAILVALVVAWFVPRGENGGSLPYLVGVIVWLGAATLAFAYLRGFGMAVCLLAAMSVLLVARHGGAVLTLGLLAALVAYRVLREFHPGAARALDIGQHYALIGLMVGAGVIAVAAEYRRERASTPYTAAIGLALCGILPVLGATLIAAKGFVGILVGLGVGTALAGMRGDREAKPLALQMGLGLFMAGSFAWYEKLLELTRDEKVKALYWSTPAVLVLALLLVVLGRRKSSPEAT